MGHPLERRVLDGGMADRIFAYGTLRRGFANHGFLTGATFLGCGRTRDHFALYVNGLPFAVREEAVSPIVGELYLVDCSILARLDRLEGHPDCYCRERVVIEMKVGLVEEAWVYFHPAAGGRLVTSGDYADG